jgi:hypothetical protein
MKVGLKEGAIRKNGEPARRPGKPANPLKKPKAPGGFGKGMPRPHVWLCGPDQNRHQMYQPWLVAKAQANFRGEEWLLPFEDYFNAWNGLWEQRGRLSNDLCMTRTDYDGPWHKDNIEIVTRKEHLGKQREYKARWGYDILGYKKPGRKPKA